MIFVSSLHVARYKLGKHRNNAVRLVNKVPSLSGRFTTEVAVVSDTEGTFRSLALDLSMLAEYCQLRFTPETALNNMGLICYTMPS
jgi:hypothetical protein